MGGDDSPNNLIYLSVQDHALAHKKLYEEYGKKEDFIAWKALSGLLTIDEIKKETQLLGASKGGKIGGITAGNNALKNKTGIHSKDREWHKNKGLNCVKQKIGIHAEEWDKSIGGKLGGNRCKERKLGIHAPTFDPGAANRGTVWINDGKVSKKCYPEDIPSGFKLGRIYKRKS